MPQTVLSPGCHSSGDLNVGANGGTWLLCNNDRSSKNVHPYDMFLPPPTRDQYFGYGKDILRRAMIEHDATFRDQVHALHRLYRRQWELMREVKRIEVAKNQSAQSNPFLSQNLTTYPLNTRQLPSAPPVLTFTNLQERSGDNRWSANKGPDPAQAEKCLLESDLMDPKGKKSKRKVFDLELPADEFMDDEESEGSGEEKVAQPKISEGPSKSNFKPFPCRRVNGLADLNEPIWLEDAVSRNFSEVQVLSEQNVQTNHEMDFKASSKIMDLQKDRHCEAVPDFLTERRCNANSLPQVSSSRQLSMSIPSQFEHPAQLLGANLSNSNHPRLNSSCVPFPFNDPMSVSKSFKPPEGTFGLDGNKFQSGNWTFEGQPRSISFNHVSCKRPSDSVLGLRFNSKCSRGSENDVNNMNVVDLNFLPPSSFLESSAISQQNIDNAGSMKKLEDSFGKLPWLKENLDYKAKPNDRNIDSISSPAFTTSICDSELKNDQISEPCNVESRFSSSQLCAPIFPSTSHPDPSEEKDVDTSEKLGTTGMNLAQQSVVDTDKLCSTTDSVLDNGFGKKMKWFGNHIDLNSCVNEEEEMMRAERDMAAPLSPENQECSPPRGESEENQVELLKLEQQDPQEELMRTAAETIVLITSSRVQRPIEEKIAVCEPSQACPSSDLLHWFADVVLVPSGDDDKDYFSDGSDYFEAMTLELPEVKVEEYCYYANTSQRMEETGSNLSRDLPRRRQRSRRVRQRKDFQTEILPSLASLSRHEVTEDLQTLEGLMGAEGKGFETGLRRRNSGRSSRSNKGRKQTSNCSNEIAIAGWGKQNRRRRGHRFPVSNPHSVFCLN